MKSCVCRWRLDDNRVRGHRARPPTSQSKFEVGVRTCAAWLDLPSAVTCQVQRGLVRCSYTIHVTLHIVPQLSANCVPPCVNKEIKKGKKSKVDGHMKQKNIYTEEGT